MTLAGLGADLNRPQLTGSTRHLHLALSNTAAPGPSTSPRQMTPASEDVSPECVSAEATLRPPPYSPGDTATAAIRVLADPPGLAHPSSPMALSAASHELSVIISDPGDTDDPGAAGRGRRALLRHLNVRSEDIAPADEDDEGNFSTTASRTFQQEYCDTSFSECDTSGKSGRPPTPS